MRRALPGIVAAIGVVLVFTGIAVFAAANAAHAGGPGDFGWAAYAPLEETHSAYRSALTFTTAGGTVLWTTGHLLGAGLVVLGALVLAGVGGWLLGRRAGRRGSATG